MKARDREGDRDQEWGWVRGGREQEECIGYIYFSELLKVKYAREPLITWEKAGKYAPRPNGLLLPLAL